MTKTLDRIETPVSKNKRAPSPEYDVAIIGAGPYRLSTAAYLKNRGLGGRVFGEPMEFWGTGYDVNISRYSFLSPELVTKVQTLDGYPDLAPGISSSVPGLHFIGAPAARNYGPLLYFVTSTETTSKYLTAHISRNRRTVG